MIHYESSTGAADAVAARRAARDLAALAALPAIWISPDLQRSLQTLAEALCAAMRSRYVYVRVASARSDTVDAAATCSVRTDPRLLDEVRRHLGAHMDLAGLEFPPSIPGPDGGPALRVGSCPVAMEGRVRGVVIACTSEAAAPSDYDRLLLHTGAAQVAILLQRYELDQRTSNEARHAEAANARTQHLMQLMPTAVCVCDAEGRVTFYNRRLVELLGAEPKVGEAWETFAAAFRIQPLQGTTPPIVVAPIVAAVRDGRAFREFELEITRPDHSSFIASTNVDPIRNAEGRGVGAIASFHDITARKRGERNTALLARLTHEVALLTEESAIVAVATRLIGEHLGVHRCYFAELDPDNARVTVRVDWRRDAGIPPLEGSHTVATFATGPLPELLVARPMMITDTLEHPDTSAAATTLAALQIRAMMTVPLPREAGRTALLAVTSDTPRTWRRDERGVLESTVARVWPMVERARAAAALRESEERFRVLTDSIAALAWTADETGARTWYNQRWYEYTGATPDDMLGRGWERVHDPEHLPRVREKIERCFAAGEAWEDTFPLRGRDGTFRWFLSRAVPIRRAAGRVTQWLGTNTDITELRAAQEQLRTRTRSMEVLNRAAAQLSEARQLERIVQSVTDAGREVSGASFGAFFYNVRNERGESFMLYTLSGAPREAFASYPMPRNSPLFAPTFRGEGVVRIGNVRKDSRFGRNAPYHGLPPGHLPVTSYLAVSVRSRSGEVLGGLFYGHPDEDVFTPDAEAAVSALAAQAAIAIDNAGLYDALQQELARTKEAEERSRRLATLVESSDDAIIGVALDGVITSWNGGAQAMFGYTSGEIIGQSVTVLLPPDRFDEEPAILHRIARGEHTEHYETVRRRKDGSLLDISLSVSPVKDREGRVLGASKIARDVTARKRAEGQQRALYDLLASVNRAVALPQIYAVALDAIVRCQNADRAAILLFDEQQVMRFAAWRGLSEQYRAAVEGHSPWTADERNPRPVCVEDTATAELDPGVRMAVEQEGIRALVFVPLSYEQRLIGKVMVYFDVPHAFSANELELAGAIATQVAFAIERQKGAQALEVLVNERTNSLRQAIAQMEEFSYSVSHDLRSPVRAMRGYAEAVLQDYGERLDADGRELLTRIERNGARMDRLIQDLLTYSRISRREIVLEPVSLQKLVGEIVEQYPEMRPEQATIDVRGPLPDVLAHEPSLTQVISNLLGNAVKFVPPGRRPHVSVVAENHDGTVRLWVVDNGIGIDPKYQYRLFGMFERIHADRNYEGTGIGLAIVRKAMERMNGRAGMQSDGKTGSQFWIELPAA